MKLVKHYVTPADPGLFDSQTRLTEITQMGDPLAALEAVMDWGLFQSVLD